MSEWRECELSQLTNKIGSGATPRGGSNSYKDEGISLIRSQNVLDLQFSNNGLAFIDNEQADALKNVVVELNDILLNITGDSVARACKVPDEILPARVNQHVAIIRADDEKLISNFLLYNLIAQKEELLSQSEIGATRRAITKGIIEKFVISLPPLPEQKAIAEVLSSLDDKIDLLHRQNKTLEQMAETLFRQWFVVEAGEDWGEGVLGDVAVNISDSVKTSEIKGDTKYVGLEHIDRRNISLNQYGFGDDVNSNKSAFEEKDILFGKLRLYFHKVCMSPFSGICSTDILVIRPKTPENFLYCLFAFFQNDVVEYANLGSGGTRMPRTNWSTLKQYPIAIPEKNIISKFNQIVEPEIDKILKNIKQIHTLQSLRDTLLPKLMSGEVRVQYDKEQTQ